MGVAKPINIAMRALQFLWALLVMALIGDMIHSSYAGNPSIVNYCMFVALFAMLSLFYLIPATIKDSLQVHPILPLIVDLLNTLFWFCAAVAMAAQLGVHSCSNIDYVNSNFITNGNVDIGPDARRTRGNQPRCREAQASTAFLFFGFAAFAASCVLSGLNMGGGGGGRSGGIRRGPAMSKV